MDDEKKELFEKLSTVELNNAGLNPYNLKYNYVLDFDATKSEIKRILEIDRKRMKEIYMIVSDFFLRHYNFKTIEREERSECYVYNGGLYTQSAFTLVDRETRRMLEEAYSGHSPTAVMAHIKAQTYISEEDFCVKDPELLPVQNGILNVRTRELIEYTPEYYFFKKLPVTYDPEAECWEIREFFDQVLPNPEDVLLLQQIFGYCLYRDYNIHKFFVFSGYGRNGKGVTLNILNKLLGVDNTTHHSLFALSDNRFMVSELFHKLANINADLPEGVIKDTGIIKELTGGDRISANRKFMPSISFKNFAKLIFSTNSMPQFHDTSEGWKRRWILIEFDERFLSKKEIKELPEEEKKNVNIADPDLLDAITTDENMSGLLNWALDGLQTLFEDKGFIKSGSDRKAWRRIRMKANPYEVFCEEEIQENAFGYITKKSLREIFARWAKDEGLKVKYIDKNMNKAIENLPYPVFVEQKQEVNYERCWVGIGLKK